MSKLVFALVVGGLIACADSFHTVDNDGFPTTCLTPEHEDKINSSSCGPAQRRIGGACQPPVAFLCSDGESDPRNTSTFAGSILDTDPPTFICPPLDETSHEGLKPMLFMKNVTGGWHLALALETTCSEIGVADARANEAGRWVEQAPIGCAEVNRCSTREQSCSSS